MANDDDVEWQGMDTLQAFLRAAPEHDKGWARSVLTDVAIEVFNMSQRQVPVRTGALRGSGAIDVVSQDPFEIAIGYGGASASYALWVHENLGARHKPPTKAKYLEDPANEVVGRLNGRLEAEVDGAIVGNYPQQASVAQASEMSAMARGVRRARRTSVKARRARPMTHSEIHAAIEAIDQGQAQRARGQRAIRRFYRSGP